MVGYVEGRQEFGGVFCGGGERQDSRADLRHQHHRDFLQAFLPTALQSCKAQYGECMSGLLSHRASPLTKNLQHGVYRASGVQPVTDQDRKKEERKIEDYKGLVNSVNDRVGRSARCHFCYS